MATVASASNDTFVNASNGKSFKCIQWQQWSVHTMATDVSASNGKSGLCIHWQHVLGHPMETVVSAYNVNIC